MAGPRYGEFEFPSSFGFSGSASDRTTTTVRSHERRRPQRFAEGGKVEKKPPPKKKEEPPPKPKGLIGRAADELKNRRARQMEELGLSAGGPVGYAKGGKKKDFIKKAIKHPGALRKELHAKAGEPIPAKKLDKAAHSSNPTLRKRAVLAKTLRKMHRD